MRKKIFYTGLMIGLLSCHFAESSEEMNTPIREEVQEGKSFLRVSQTDSSIFYNFIEWAASNQLGEQSLSDVVVDVARYFLGKPYVPHTLEIEGEEQLVVNLREFDCTTFVENVLALSYCLKSGRHEMDQFAYYLQQLRYRDGKIEGYPSRLHYISEWFVDNEEKGLIDIVSNRLGQSRAGEKINFMSAHAESYPKLKDNIEFIQEISEIEHHISSYDLKYIDEEQIENFTDSIQNGDVIAFCTTIEGLDVVHLGLALHTKNKLHFIHASTRGNKVKISETDLSEYVRNRKNVYGIFVGRPKQVNRFVDL
jgi:cell wall-associated NlpC family hydrolase